MNCFPRSMLCVLIAASSLTCLNDSSHASELISKHHPEIWFGPMQDHFDPAARVVSYDFHDFLKMIASDEGWIGAARASDALMFNSTHAVEGFDHSGVPSLARIANVLKNHRLRAAGAGPVIYTDGVCGKSGTEGISMDHDFAREIYFTSRVWKEAGLPMDFFVMDGPFGFGINGDQINCHYTIDEVARRAATSMKKIRELYPNILVIDAEGCGRELPAQWLPQYKVFVKAFQKYYGAPIAFLDMDLHWIDAWHTGYRWPNAANEIAKEVHKWGLKVSLIVNAEDGAWDVDLPLPEGANPTKPAVTEEYWMAAVRKHIEIVKRDHIPLDAIDLESWMRFPVENLPESDPSAFASLVMYADEILRARSN